LQAGTELPAAARIASIAPTLTEQLGDAALLDLDGPPEHGKPASVLMIRSEAGWRIRGYLSGVPATGSPDSSG